MATKEMSLRLELISGSTLESCEEGILDFSKQKIGVA